MSTNRFQKLLVLGVVCRTPCRNERVESIIGLLSAGEEDVMYCWLILCVQLAVSCRLLLCVKILLVSWKYCYASLVKALLIFDKTLPKQLNWLGSSSSKVSTWPKRNSSRISAKFVYPYRKQYLKIEISKISSLQ